VDRLGVRKRMGTAIERLKLRYFIYSINPPKPTKKILFGPGFNIGRTFTNHDIIIAGLLRHNGAEIHYPYGRWGFKSNYPFFGGRWGDTNLVKNEKSLTDGENRAFSYFKLLGDTHYVADYINETDLKEINDTVFLLSETEMLSYHYRGISIGHDAMNTVRNLYMVDQISLVDDYLSQLREALHDCMIYVLYFERVIAKVQPDIIFSHDCFYMPWSHLGNLADKYGIKFYNYYMGLHPDTWVYTNRSPSMEFEFMNNIWLENENRTLSHEEKNKLGALLSDRKKGKVGNLDLKTSEDITEWEYLLNKLENKPFVVFYSNIFWDLAALDKGIIFQTIEDAICFLIEWFEKRPEFNLILKPHPAEKHELIPETMQTVGSIIEHKFKTGIPANIHYLNPLTNISSYDLFPHSACTLAWTGTSGIESVIFGTPTISLANAHYRGKGFTTDPLNINDLGNALEKHLTSKQMRDDKQIDLAKKYFYLFQYALSKNVGIPTMRYNMKAPELNWKTAETYLKNEYLEKVINSIVSMRDIT